MNNFDRNLVDIAWILVAAFILFTLGVFAIDVKAIGPEGTTIGFSALNGFVYNLTGTHEILDKICDLFILLALVPAGAAAYFGVKQIREGRKLLQLDRAILAMIAVYASLVIIYVAFELLPVNYRPVILGDESMPEASFPSSHTLFACTTMGCAFAFARIRLTRLPVGNIIAIVAAVVFVLAVVLRIASGVHWFSDIAASVLLSCAIACFYGAAIEEQR